MRWEDKHRVRMRYAAPRHDRDMPRSPTRASHAAARGRRLELALGAELNVARRAHGLSQSSVARVAGVQQTRVSRIERGEASRASLAEVNAVAEAVGLRLVVRCYPIGNALRDYAQVALLQELRVRLDSTWRSRTEVPMPIAGDLRAADALITGNGCTIVVEAWTRLTDLQAQTRAAQLKRQAFGNARLLILLADTWHNRAAMREAAGSIRADFPLGTRGMLAALASGRNPGADGIAILRIGSRFGLSPGRARKAKKEGALSRSQPSAG